MSTYNVSLSIFKRQIPKIIPITIMSAAAALIFLGTQDEFDIAVVNESSEFEPQKFYYI